MAPSTRAMAMTPSAFRLPSARQVSLGHYAPLRALSTINRAQLTHGAFQTATARPSVALHLAHTGRVAFQRSYADAPPKAKPGKLRRTFRWAWRLTYLSATGLLGYTCYTIWQDRHPEPQAEPDPNKKTLVILGKPPTKASICAAHVARDS